MTDDDRMDTRLRAHAERWRDAAAPAPTVDVTRLAPRPAGRAWWLAGLSAAAIVLAILGGTVLVGHDGSAPPKPLHTPTPTGGVVPWAALPPTHPQIPAQTTPASPDPAEAAGAPDCRATNLHATGRPGAAAGTYYLTVRLTLAGDHPCRLEGYPAVHLLDKGRAAPIPLEHLVDDSVYRGPVLVADGHPALLQLSWSANWCVAPVHNDTIHLVLPGGFLTLPGLGGSQCYGTPGSGHRQPVEIRTFEPAKHRDAVSSTAYADVDVAGALDIATTPGATVDFVVTLTSPHDLVLDPCPDYQIIQSGEAGPATESYALNCAAVPYKDAHGRPYLPAGTPVRFAMRTTAGAADTDKLSWHLDTVDALGTSGTLTVTPATPVTPGAAATATDPTQRRAAVHAGVPVVQAFLDAYRRDGIVVAARKYLPPDSRPDTAAGVPRLASGTVTGAVVSSWESPDQFTLEVRLDLHFDGDPGAWNEGHNDRFVTFTRTDGALRIVEIATSP